MKGRPKIKTISECAGIGGESIVEDKIVEDKIVEGKEIRPVGDIRSDFNKDDGEYKINVIKDYHGGVDITYLNKKDPNYVYRWLYSDHKNLAMKTGNVLAAKGGWQLCSRAHLKNRLGITDADISADGLLRRGDLILSFMPKELYEEKEELKKKKANYPMDVVERKLKEGDSSVAGIGHRNMKGIQTQKQLGMK